MKKNRLCLILAAIFFQMHLFAQFNKGDLIAGGSFNANLITSANSPVNVYHVEFYPRFGYYFVNRLSTGIDPVGQFEKDCNEVKSNNFGFGSFVGYNHVDYLFTEISYNYLFLNDSIPVIAKAGLTSKVSHVNDYTLSRGYVSMLNKHPSIKPKLGYTINTASNEVASQGPAFSIALYNYFWKVDR